MAAPGTFTNPNGGGLIESGGSNSLFTSIQQNAPWIFADDSGTEGQLFAENIWDTVVLGGMKLPGICKCSSEPSRQLDIHSAPGADVAAVLFRGYRPPVVDIECLVWTKAQWDRLCWIISQIWAKPNRPPLIDQHFKGKTANQNRVLAEARATLENESAVRGAQIAETQGLAIYHPALSAVGINTVAIQSISTAVPGSEPQTLMVKFRCNELVRGATAIHGPSANTAKKVVGSGTVNAAKTNDDFTNNPAQNVPSKTDAGPSG